MFLLSESSVDSSAEVYAWWWSGA